MESEEERPRVLLSDAANHTAHEAHMRSEPRLSSVVPRLNYEDPDTLELPPMEKSPKQSMKKDVSQASLHAQWLASI